MELVSGLGVALFGGESVTPYGAAGPEDRRLAALQYRGYQALERCSITLTSRFT